MAQHWSKVLGFSFHNRRKNRCRKRWMIKVRVMDFRLPWEYDESTEGGDKAKKWKLFAMLKLK